MCPWNTEIQQGSFFPWQIIIFRCRCGTIDSYVNYFLISLMQSSTIIILKMKKYICSGNLVVIHFSLNLLNIFIKIACDLSETSAKILLEMSLEVSNKQAQ